MKISIELDNRDWGVVAKALDSHLGRARTWAAECRSMLIGAGRDLEVARIARIRTEFVNQRRAARKEPGEVSVPEYCNLVIDLFKSGEATDDMWREMAQAVLGVSESSGCPAIDAAIDDCKDVE